MLRKWGELHQSFLLDDSKYETYPKITSTCQLYTSFFPMKEIATAEGSFHQFGQADLVWNFRSKKKTAVEAKSHEIDVSTFFFHKNLRLPTDAPPQKK